MVEGGKRGILRRYDLQDQLAGITALGATGRREALEYLERLYTPAEGIPQVLAQQAVGRELGVHFIPTHERKVVDYPNARGKLRAALRHEVETFYAVEHKRMGFYERRVARQTDTRDRRVHQTVRAAIDALRKALGEASQRSEP